MADPGVMVFVKKYAPGFTQDILKKVDIAIKELSKPEMCKKLESNSKLESVLAKIAAKNEALKEIKDKAINCFIESTQHNTAFKMPDVLWSVKSIYLAENLS